MPRLAVMLAEAAGEIHEGALADFCFKTEDEWRRFNRHLDTVANGTDSDRTEYKIERNTSCWIRMDCVRGAAGRQNRSVRAAVRTARQNRNC